MTYSQPMESYVSARGRSVAITVLMIVQLVALVLSTVGYAIALDGHELTGALGLVIGGIVLNLVYIVAGALFLVMVRGAQSRQDEMWLDLERQRSVPQPSAAALR